MGNLLAWLCIQRLARLLGITEHKGQLKDLHGRDIAGNVGGAARNDVQSSLEHAVHAGAQGAHITAIVHIRSDISTRILLNQFSKLIIALADGIIRGVAGGDNSQVDSRVRSGSRVRGVGLIASGGSRGFCLASAGGKAECHGQSQHER